MMNKKSITLITSLALLLLIIVGGTTAYLVASTNPVTNTFNPSEITSEVVENFDGETKEDVTIKNTGDVSAYIRAAVIVNWKNDNGDLMFADPSEYTWTGGPNGDSSNWVKIGNYYYYTEKVAAGGETNNLIDKIEVANGVNPPAEGYYLDVVILGSAIQSEPAAAIEEAWRIDPVKWEPTTSN